MLVRPARRTQQQRTDATRAALVAAAVELFAELGFHAVPADAIVRRAGVTSGALYHHFRDKRDLFRAAFDEAEASLARRVTSKARRGKDPWDRLERGVTEYLRACRQPAVRSIVLRDGPSVLGWEEWHEADAAYHLRPLAEALASAMRAGLMPRRPAEPLAHVLLGSLTEAGLLVGRAGESERQAVMWLLRRLRS